MNVLLVARTAPENPYNGDDLRCWSLLQGQADILCFSRSNDICPHSGDQVRLPWRRIRIVNQCPAPSGSRQWIDDPFVLAREYRSCVPSLLAAISGHRATHPDQRLIITDHALALALMTELPDGFIFDACDSRALHFRRRARAYRFSNLAQAADAYWRRHRYTAAERRIASRATLYLVAGEADRQCVSLLCPSANVQAVPIGTRWIDDPPIKPASEAQPPVIAFHGRLSWDPNRTCAAYLAEKIFPRVARAIPGVRLRIAGAPVTNKLQGLARHPGVEFSGFVRDLRYWLEDAHVYAMPMVHGSGVKTKLVEAMAAGLPVVTNTLGAEALPETCRKAIVSVDGTKAFADAIVALLRSPSRRAALRAAARSAAEYEFVSVRVVDRYQKAIASAC